MISPPGLKCGAARYGERKNMVIRGHATALVLFRCSLIGLNQAPQAKEFATDSFHHAVQRHLPTVSATMAVQSSPYFSA
jgi:hypothetical protein